MLPVHLYLVMFLFSSPSGESKAAGFGEVYAEARNSVVSVVAVGADGETLATGSGVFAGPHGQVVTNLHVVAGATKVKIITPGGESTEVQELSAFDETSDLAVLNTGLRQKPLALAVSGPTVGDVVVAIGDPLALRSTLTNGIVSGLRVLDGVSYIQTTAAISPGSSGGALIGMNGKLLGITTFHLRDAQNLNFAVAASHVADVLGRHNRGPFPSADHSSKPSQSDRDLKAEQAAIDQILSDLDRRTTHVERVAFLEDQIADTSHPAMVRASMQLLLGTEFELHGKNREALAAFEAALHGAIEARSAIRPLHYRLCRSYYFNDRFSESVVACRVAVDELASEADLPKAELENAWTYLALSNEVLERYSDAVEAYEHAVGLGPNYGTLAGLARAYRLNGDEQLAVNLCRDAQRLFTEVAAKAFPLGCAKQKR